MKNQETKETVDEKSNKWQEMYGYDWKKHHYHRGNIIVGIVLVVVGLLLFFNTTGAVSWHVWYVIRAFWPVLLILIGIRTLLGNNWLSRFIMAVITIIVCVTIVLFAIRYEQPQVRNQLPSGVNQLLDRMEVLQIPE